MNPPIAKKQDKVLEIHGDKREDPYFWLNDQENSDVISYLNKENDFLSKGLSHTNDLQEILFEELKGRIKETDDSSPMKEGNYWYFHRYLEGKQYPIYCRNVGSDEGPEEKILDHNELAEGKAFCDIGFVSNSPDHRYIAFGVDENGDEKYEIFIKDLSADTVKTTGIKHASTSFEWLGDSKSFLFNTLDENLRPRFVYRSSIDERDEPQLVFEEKDPRFFVWIDASEDEEFKFICLHGNNMSEAWFSKNDPEDLNFERVCQRKPDHEYSVSHLDGKLLILSNWKASNYAFYTSEFKDSSPDSWQSWREYDPDILTESFTIYEGYIAIQEKERALPRIRILDRSSDDEFYIDYGNEPCELDIISPREYQSESLRYVHSSMCSPACTFDFYFKSQSKKLVKIQEIPDQSFDASNYVTERIYVDSDGVQVPVSILYKKGFVKDGSRKLYLYAYGSYGSSMEPSFSSSRFSYVDRGFAYAIVHPRGGMELGRQWYLDGKLKSKENTFKDYIAAAEALIESGYTSKGNIIAKGGSAGGMLMGVVANWRPDLFGAIIADVPFVDVLTTMLDDTLPLTTIEYNEWGNPNEKDYYDYIKGYSPYDNVAKQNYPPMLVICGLNDMRVTYWEPAKWVARLRDFKTDENPLFLKTHMDAGHSGASGRYDYLKDLALEIAFVLEGTSLHLVG